jgi:negative modulator of initiation of replication
MLFATLAVWRQMPHIEIDSDLEEYLRQHQELTGESASDYIRKLIAARLTRDSPIQPRSAAVTDLSKFLAILAEMQTLYSDRFPAVANVRGRTRVYFARSKDDIEASSQSAAPVQIPNTEWWVVSNNCTSHKRRMLKRAFRAVGCSREEIQRWLEQFDARDPRSLTPPPYHEDRDDNGGPTI